MHASIGILSQLLLMSEIQFLPSDLFCNFSTFEFPCNNCFVKSRTATFSLLPVPSLFSRVSRIRETSSANPHCSMNEAAFTFHRWWIAFCVFRVGWCCHLTGLSQRGIFRCLVLPLGAVNLTQKIFIANFWAFGKKMVAAS